MAFRNDIERQVARLMQNIGGNQYNLQQNIQLARASFLQHVAATKTKASHLVILGFLMVTGGSAAFMLSILGAMNDFNNTDLSNMDYVQSPDMLPGPKIHGIPIGLIGFGVGFIGQFVLVMGIVLHIISAARRRYVEERFLDLLHVTSAMPRN